MKRKQVVDFLVVRSRNGMGTLAQGADPSQGSQTLIGGEGVGAGLA